MKAIVKLSDKITLEIEEQNEMETLHRAVVLGNPRRKCHLCGNGSDFYFTTNKAKSKDGKGPFVYINYKCSKCDARSQLGRYEAGGYFWREFEKYQPSPRTEEPPQPEGEG